MAAWYNKDYKKAVHYFTIAVTCGDSPGSTENDVRDFLLRETKRGLMTAQEILENRKRLGA